MKPIWVHTGSWLAVTAAAVMLAFGTPNPYATLSRLPSDVGAHLGRTATPAPPIDDGRVLALVTFHRNQRAQADSWIEGLALHGGSPIRWVRMPVFEDPKDAQRRVAAEDQLRSRYAGRPEYAHLVPVFTDRTGFMRATGVTRTTEAVVLVLSRDGEVLARESGRYDEDKALHLLATLALDF
jgi:hypothetical protein